MYSQAACCRLMEFVGRSMDPPRNDAAAGVLAARCAYCGLVCPLAELNAHLVDAHVELVFHCEECYTFVDRTDLIPHMTAHAMQYPSIMNIKTEPKDDKRNRDEKENTEERKCPKMPPELNGEGTRSKQGKGSGVIKNEFSDHSDAEDGFGPLPESVFEAIEDSQESQPAAGSVAPSCPPPGSVAPSCPSPESATTSCSSPESVTPSCPSPGSVALPSLGSVAPPCPPPSSEIFNKPKQAQKIEPHKRSRTCPLCSKVFTASSSYFYHVKHFHARSKEHECDVCGKKFATRANLMQHGPIHTGECQFECRLCGKRFKSKASHYIHLQTHSNLKKYACAQCHKTFRWRTHLLRHMKRHAAEKSHLCTVCGRGFSIKCDLLRHARTHTAGNFACDTCGHKFAQLRYLTVHKERKHCVNQPGKVVDQGLED